MDRSDELRKLAALSAVATAASAAQHHDDGTDAAAPATTNPTPATTAGSTSRYITIARRVVVNIDGNEALVRRMEKLSTRKEFSNDPTQEMAEISDLFHMKVALIQTDFQLLKQLTEIKVQASNGQHQMQHYKLMMQTLNKRHVMHVDAFKAALKVHSENVKQRQSRVGKYGQGQDQVRAALLGAGEQPAAQSSSASTSSNTPLVAAPSSSSSTSYSSSSSSVGGPPPVYAMFASPRVEVQISQELRRRGASASVSSSTSSTTATGPSGGWGPPPTINGASNDGYGKAPPFAPPIPIGFAAATAPKSAFVNGKPPQYEQQYHTSRYGGGAAYSTSYGGGGGYFANHAHTNSSGGGGGSYMQMQLQQQPPPSHSLAQQSRLKSAEQVERSIAQMGQLFSQMATLVMEQSETISRIEDDVEVGLEETKEAHVSMEQFYEISKGNRSLIIKVFLLLAFFILLFLVWT